MKLGPSTLMNSALMMGAGIVPEPVTEDNRAGCEISFDNVEMIIANTKILNGVSFSVTQDEIVGIIGPNGAGKTTLFNLMTGFLKPTAGTILLDGSDITGAKPFDLWRRGIARTFQIPRPFEGMTVLQNVLVSATFCRDRKLEQPPLEAACKLLQRFGLDDKRDLYPGTLTAPERKMLDLARALATRPRILAVDEFITGMNPSEMRSFIRLFLELRGEGITILLIEHLMQFVCDLCDKVIVLDAGEKIFEGSTMEAMKDRKVIAAYLGTGGN